MKKLFLLCTILSSQAFALPATQPNGLPLNGIPDTIDFFSAYPTINKTNWYISNGWTNGAIQSCQWMASAISADARNVKITLSDKGGSVRPYGCGEMQSIKTYGYGTYSTSMKTASGSGLNSAFFTYTGTPGHDEIDFEFLGKNTHTVQLNYFASGIGGHEKIIDLGFDAAASFHSYAFTWTPSDITWYVDGKQVYKTKAGAKMPANPSKIYLQLWSGSSLVNGWLGAFNYKGPYNAEFAWVKFDPLAE